MNSARVILAIFVSATLSSIGGPLLLHSRFRTLSVTETQAISGGSGTFQGSCCLQNGACDILVTNPCNGLTAMTCYGKNQVATGQNTEWCGPGGPSDVCNEGINVVCRKTYSCVWDSATGTCSQNTTPDPNTEIYNPMYCNDTCP